MASIVTLRSGQPFTPVISGDTANTGVSSQRPNVNGAPILVGQPTCWFYLSSNSACSSFVSGVANTFTVPGTYTYGNGGRNILRADSLKQVDFTLLKMFPITERTALQFRAEMFNILNHPVFAIPNTTINNASGGQVSSTLNSARIIQLALKLSF